MRLDTLFEQRTVGAVFSSIRSRKQLPFPSGPQFTESAQESAIVDQLAFSPFVHDLVTQAVIRFDQNGKQRRYTCDVFVEYRVPDQEAERFMIEAKRQQDIEANDREHAARFAAAKAWCNQNGAMFCLLNEDDIKTTYLDNVRLLAESRGISVDERLTNAVAGLRLKTTSTVSTVKSSLEQQGLSRAEATVAVEHAVIARALLCDLTKPFRDTSPIRRSTSVNTPDRADPFLATLRRQSRQSRM